MHNRAKQDTARLFRADGYRPTDRVKARVLKIFDGFGNEKILEDFVREAANAETSETRSGDLRDWRIAAVGPASGLVGKYGRTEVPLPPPQPAPDRMKGKLLRNGRCRRG